MSFEYVLLAPTENRKANFDPDDSNTFNAPEAQQSAQGFSQQGTSAPMQESQICSDDEDPDYEPNEGELQTDSSEEEDGSWKMDDNAIRAEEHTIADILPETDPEKAAEQLHKNGYVLLRFMDEPEVASALDEFKRTLCEDLPEFKPADCTRNTNWEYGCTGFGAVNTASSFHNRFVRALRLRAHVVVAPVLNHYRMLTKHPNAKEVRLQQLFGRMSVRVRSPTSELWHQDNAEKSQYGDGDYRDASRLKPLPDVTFGGWIAFNQGKDPITGESMPQAASLYSNSHGYFVPAKVKNQIKNLGFGRLSYSDMTHLIEDRGSEETGNPTIKTLVLTPSGTIFLMHQTIVHEVRSVKPPEAMFRLYLQFRLTSDDKDLLEFGNPIPPNTITHAQDGDHRAQNLDEVCDLMLVPKLPSNQMPSMYNRKGIDMHSQKPKLLRWFNLYLRNQMRVDENVFVGTGRPKPLPSNMAEDTMIQNGPEPKYYIMRLHAPSLWEIQTGHKYQGMQDLEGIDWRNLFPVYEQFERSIMRPSTNNFELQHTMIQPLLERLSAHTSDMFKQFCVRVLHRI
ncbi:hypothetical protein CYMTET_42773 [Cymbomonas tetramitiformis]|uniref:Uncharacterized protein n=1 Tax=Cymbomonas tetramitiformis TaxID=36881 RepID=A0AAE0C5G5_9CHLO|nr:hypothetical protein CYMTET_42773 [Cymbomonas tetramitiformis]